MAGRRSPVTDIREIVRRLQLGEPDRRIARDLGVGRNTVARYRQWAKDQGLLHAALPEAASLAALLRPAPAEGPVHEQSLVEPFRERVKALHDRRFFLADADQRIRAKLKLGADGRPLLEMLDKGASPFGTRRSDSMSSSNTSRPPARISPSGPLTRALDATNGTA